MVPTLRWETFPPLSAAVSGKPCRLSRPSRFQHGCVRPRTQHGHGSNHLKISNYKLPRSRRPHACPALHSPTTAGTQSQYTPGEWGRENWPRLRSTDTAIARMREPQVQFSAERGTTNSTPLPLVVARAPPAAEVVRWLACLVTSLSRSLSLSAGLVTMNQVYAFVVLCMVATVNGFVVQAPAAHSRGQFVSRTATSQVRLFIDTLYPAGESHRTCCVVHEVREQLNPAPHTYFSGKVDERVLFCCGGSSALRIALC